jgi:hypothetical protein
MAYIQEGIGNYTNALYHLEQYQRVSPSEEVLRKMDELASKHSLGGYAMGDSTYLQTLYFKHQYWLVPCLILLGGLGLGLLYLLRRRGSGTIKPVMILLLYFALCAGLLNTMVRTPAGIVARDGALVMEAPSAGATMVTELKAGHKLQIVGEQDIWVKVMWQGKPAYVRKGNVMMF